MKLCSQKQRALPMKYSLGKTQPNWLCVKQSHLLSLSLFTEKMMLLAAWMLWYCIRVSQNVQTGELMLATSFSD